MDARERFVAAVNLPAAEVPLDVAALCIAAHAHPGLDVDAWCARLDELAARCPAPDFDALRVHLFEREGFAGNLDHYEDPENSLLDSVIERRRGISTSRGSRSTNGCSSPTSSPRPVTSCAPQSSSIDSPALSTPTSRTASGRAPARSARG